MNTQPKNTDQEKISLTCKRRDPKGYIEFAKQLNEYFTKGYMICTDDVRGVAPIFAQHPKVTMVLRPSPESIPVDVNGNILEDDSANAPKSHLEVLESLNKKDALLEFAKELSIEIPEAVNKPLAIKKLIKEKLSGVEQVSESTTEVKQENSENKDSSAE